MNRLQLIACAGALASTAAVIGAPHGASEPVAIHSSLSFGARVERYAALRQSLIADVRQHIRDAEPGDAEFRRALAAALRDARRNAISGDVFGPVMSERVFTVVRSYFASRGPERRRDILSELPTVDVVHVNDLYPADAPLASMPAVILEQLDSLPPELQYRFFGSAVMLLDADTGVIVDLVAHALDGTT